MNEHTIGDRVSRDETNLGWPYSGKVLHGTVIDVTSDYFSRFGPYPELYHVIWDGQSEPSGSYLPHGIRGAV